MGRKPAAEQGDTLADIRRVSFRLFGRHGYDGVSLGQVAKAAGVTKAALYWHFDGKGALFLDCMTHLHTKFATYVFAAMAAADGPAESVFAMFSGTADLVDDPEVRDGVAGFWLLPNTADVPEVEELQRGFQERAEAAIAGPIASGLASGVFHSETDVIEMTKAIFAILQSIVLPLQSQTQRATRRLLATLAYTLFRAHAADSALADRYYAALNAEE